MARSRNIKPGFFLNDRLAEIDPLGRLLFAGLWTIADREGRLEDRPKKIKACVLPYDNCDIDQLLNQLANRDFIIRYQAEGNQYIAITSWHKHQNPHMKESASEIPEPCEHHTSTVLEQDLHRTSPADSLNLIPLTLNLIPDSLNDDVKEKNPKIKYADSVSMTEEEHAKLINQLGESKTTDMIDRLNNYKLSKGKKYKSDYHTILNWVRKDEGGKSNAINRGSNGTDYDPNRFYDQEPTF